MMSREKAQGGLGIPDLRNYHKAIVLARALDWAKGSVNKRWVNLEMSLSNVRLNHMIWNPPQHRNLGVDTHVLTHLTLKIWDQIHRTRKWEYNSPLIYLKDNTYFPPGMEEVGGNWILNREAQLKDIINRGKICTYKELVIKRDLLKVNGWRYGQLEHFVKSVPGSLRDEADYRPMEKLFCRATAKRNISAVYKILINHEGEIAPPFIKKWEEDLGVRCEKRWVGSILGATHNTAVDMKTNETSYKCLARWYMTPIKISKFNPDRSPECWRGCKAPGTMAHLWWECPKIQIFGGR